MAPQAPGSSRAAAGAASDGRARAGWNAGRLPIRPHVSRAWRIVFTLLFLILVGGAGYGVVTYTHSPLPPTRQNVEIVSTLEAHTKNAGSGGNAIPAFLRLPGVVGVLEPSMTAQDRLKDLSDADLGTGFCTPSLAKLIRYEFPGFYENWPDDKLERVALEKYPEFQDRLCALPSQLGVSPDDVVKYRLRSRTIVELAILWSRTALHHAGVRDGAAERVLPPAGRSLAQGRLKGRLKAAPTYSSLHTLGHQRLHREVRDIARHLDLVG